MKFIECPSFKTLLTIMLLLMFGCSSKETNSVNITPEYNLGLTLRNEIVTLEIDSVTSNISNFLTYYEEPSTGAGFLFSINTFMNELQVFDLDNEKILKTIPVEMNGERGVGPFKAVYVKNMENIYLFPNEDYSVYKIDTSGMKFEKVEYSQLDGYNNAMISSTFFSASPSIVDNRLIVKTLYQGNYRSISNKELSKKHTAFSINLLNGETAFLPHYFPKDYYSKGMKHFEFSMDATGGKTVYSFFGDHNLYFSDDVERGQKAKYAASRYFEKELDNFPAEGDGLDRGRYFSTSSHYGSIIFDKYRNVYYRFCYPEIELNDVKEMRSNIQYPKKFSIMILDEDLNIMGETLFKSNRMYIPKNVFVGKDGLYISMNHPDNPSINEGAFTFGILDLSEKSN